MQTPIKILIAVLVVLVVGCGGLLGWAYTTYKNIGNDPTAAFTKTATSVDKVQVTDNSGKVQTVQKDENTYNILLLGIDSNTERESEAKGKRSDMLMLCSINFKTNAVNLISIPRDTYAHVYKLDTEGNRISDFYSKITNAYSYGGTDKYYGANNSMACVQELLECDGKLSVPIDMYFSIDMDGITDLCDVLGGVEVTLTEDLQHMSAVGSKPTGTYIGRKGDTVTLKGDDAETFVRMRHAYAGGDFTRTKHQQQFILAILKKVQSMGAAKAIPQLFPKLLEFAKTNITLDQALAFASKLDEISIDDIQYQTLEGKSAKKNGASVVVLDDEAKYELMLKVMYGYSDSDATSAAESGAVPSGTSQAADSASPETSSSN